MDDNKRFCPQCQQPQAVLFSAYGWMRCLTCGAEFQIGASLKASLEHARATIAQVAAKTPR